MPIYLGVPVPEDVLRRLRAVPHHAGQVEVVPLLQEDVGAAQNLSNRLFIGIIILNRPVFTLISLYTGNIEEHVVTHNWRGANLTLVQSAVLSLKTRSLEKRNIASI